MCITYCRECDYVYTCTIASNRTLYANVLYTISIENAYSRNGGVLLFSSTYQSYTRTQTTLLQKIIQILYHS